MKEHMTYMRLFLEGHKPESKRFVKIFDRKPTVANYSNIMVLDDLFQIYFSFQRKLESMPWTDLDKVFQLYKISGFSYLRGNDNFLQVRHNRLMKSPDIQLPNAN